MNYGITVATLISSIKYDDRYRYRSRLEFSEFDWKSFRFVNSGIVYVPDSHPTPSASFRFWGFSFGSFLVGLVGRCRLRGVASLGSLPLLLCCSMRHACVTSYGRRWPRQPPPPLGLSLLLFRSPRVLGQGRRPAVRPSLNALLSRPGLPTSIRQSLKARARMMEVGERQPYCHTNA